MKQLALLFVLALLLPACPPTTPNQPTTPNPTTPTSEACPKDALLPAKLAAPLPPVQQWAGQLPTLPSANVAWVLAPADSQESMWWLFLVEVEKNYIANVYSLPQDKVNDVSATITATNVNTPRIFLAVLGGARPLPVPPGPIGGPDLPTAVAALNLGRASFWAGRIAEPQDQIPGPINKVPQQP